MMTRVKRKHSLFLMSLSENDENKLITFSISLFKYKVQFHISILKMFSLVPQFLNFMQCIPLHQAKTDGIRI